MTDKEIGDYNYLYNTQGKDAANDYLEYLRYDLNQSNIDNVREKNAEFAEKHPVLASAASVPANLVSGIGAVDVLGQNVARTLSGEYKPIDYNRGSMAPTAVTTSIRSTVAKDIADSTGVIQISEEEHPILSRVLNGKSWGDVYQLGMSMVDSAAVAGLSFAGIPGGTALLGGSAASQGILDALEAGATDSQALTMGILNGVFEALFEEVSLDKLLNGDPGSIVKAVLQQGFVEGSEEFCTTVANTIADTLVMGDKSEFQRNMAEYMGQGMDKQQAALSAFGDMAIGMGWDFVGGILSGGIMAGGKVGIDYLSNNAGNSALEKTTHIIWLLSFRNIWIMLTTIS